MKSLLQRVIALILLVTFPSYSLAQDVTQDTFPEWEILKLKVGERACFDLEGAKKARIYALECQHCRSKIELVEAEVHKLRELNSQSKAIIESNISVIDNLKVTLDENAELLLDRQSRLDSAETYSVFGAALPWVLLVTLGAAAGGYLLGATSSD